MPRSDVNSLWGRKVDAVQWELELMLDEADEDYWVFRREPVIRRPLSTIVRQNAEGIPYLAPEIQLLLYTNDVIGIDPERRINNGEPALHANLIAAALPRQGEHVVHIGTGVGYYTAILAHLVGSSGRVTGIEFESDLAARAKVNFSASPNVEIIQGDGTVIDFDTANVIYVNAGATQPARAWLET